MVESLEDIREIGEMTRVEFRAGDKFVLMFPHRIPRSTYEQIHSVWEQFSGGSRLLILEDGARLGVIGEAIGTG